MRVALFALLLSFSPVGFADEAADFEKAVEKKADQVLLQLKTHSFQTLLKQQLALMDEMEGDILRAEMGEFFLLKKTALTTLELLQSPEYGPDNKVTHSALDNHIICFRHVGFLADIVSDEHEERLVTIAAIAGHATLRHRIRLRVT